MNNIDNILLNMKMMNIIKDDDNMEYISNYNGIKIEMSRNDSNYTNNSKYIIFFKVFNLYGTLLTELRFDEFKALEILNLFGIQFIDEYCYNNGITTGYNDNINSFNDMTIKNIHIEALNIQLRGITNIDENNCYRNILFQINQLSVLDNSCCNMVVMMLSLQELSDLLYNLYYVSLLDINIDPIYDEEIDNIGVSLNLSLNNTDI